MTKRITTRALFTAIAGASATALLLAGCSDGPAAPPADDGGDAGAYSVQFVNPLPNYPVWRLVGDCMADAAEAAGVEFTESGPTGQGLDATAMIEQVQQATAAGMDAIITFPASDAFAPVLVQAQEAGIVTASLYGSGLPDSGADVNIGPDFEAQGALFISAVEQLPGDKKIGLIAASDTGVGGSWLTGVKAAVEAGENMEIIGEVYTGDDASAALDQTNALLTANPEINVIITHMGTVTQGAVTAIESRGLTGEVQFIGNGPDNGGLEALKSGAAHALLVQSVCGAAEDAISAVVERLDSGEAPGSAPIENLPVGNKMASKDDIDQLMSEGWQ